MSAEEENMRIVMDFYRDWIELLRAELRARGFTVDAALPPQQVSYQFFNFIRRTVDPRPRRIHQATQFHCPPELRRGIDLLKAKIEAGSDVGPNLSRKLKDVSDTDLLLADWGVHHFHLGEIIEADGYVNRTGPLLFARVDADDFYMIDVRAHGAWSRQEFLQIIHNKLASRHRSVLPPRGVDDREATVRRGST